MVPSCPKRLPCRTAQKAVEGEEWGLSLNEAGLRGSLEEAVAGYTGDPGLGRAGIRLWAS